MHNPRKMNKGLERKCGITIIIRSYDIIGEIRRVDVIVDTNNDNNKITQATDHSVNGKISAIPTNTIDGIDHGDDYRYNKLHLLHECKIWEAARATSAAPTHFRDMFIDMPEAMTLDSIKRNIRHTINLKRNPITNEFNFSYLFLTDKVAIGLNQCARDFDHLIKNRNIYTRVNRNKKINEIIDTINRISCFQSDNNNNNNFTIKKLTKKRWIKKSLLNV